eukprot:CAMPEP_0173395644 /NCGR_PEP_ID=MMETSP1356-20130122/32799_1 /TAXON_ID=77927 ORGANISM="Hemiselmis virescens, Strain PCC157" /NCGR_SAMPLE_ID=MMETSP1356 /ASSEMBLY_ACC=CAM_ASM_000847 /LENGTH=86 /DNA_ID=CAMNT_0014354443 /DNA_START=368 /DNA_END=628 /DNA_ORIENTATION=+
MAAVVLRVKLEVILQDAPLLVGQDAAHLRHEPDGGGGRGRHCQQEAPTAVDEPHHLLRVHLPPERLGMRREKHQILVLPLPVAAQS